MNNYDIKPGTIVDESLGRGKWVVVRKLRLWASNSSAYVMKHHDEQKWCVSDVDCYGKFQLPVKSCNLSKGEFVHEVFDHEI